MAGRHASRIALPLLWLACIAAPADGWGLFSGRPLTLLAIAALAAVCWLWFAGAVPGVPSILACALIVKILSGVFLLAPRGFDARYYANADFREPLERSAEPSAPSFTRVDRRLRFGVAGADDLPVAFVNDVVRFNFYRADQPSRSTLPISVVWMGFVRVDRPGPATFYLRAPGGVAQLSVGREPTLQTTNGEMARRSTLAPGFHRVMASLSVAAGGARRIDAGQIVEGREVPFDTAMVYRRPLSTAAAVADTAARRLSRVGDAALCAWLAIACLRVLRDWYRRGWRRLVVRDALAAMWACAIVDALVFAAPAIGRMMTLLGGNDWLAYESLSRDILVNGVAMTQGAPPGHVQPFYYQPLYPYFLAACHWLTGDGLEGIFFVQRLLVAAGAIAMWRTTAALFGERVAVAGAAAAGLLFYGKVAAWSDFLLSEALFIPLLCAWVYLLVRLPFTPADRAAAWAAGAGLVGGLATLTRSTLLLGWLAVVPAVACTVRPVWLRRQVVGILVATLVAVTSLATIRNAIVAHAFVPIASSGPVNLYLGNLPQSAVTIPAEHGATYQRFGLDTRTQQVIEYARQRPAAFADGLRRKALYTLGWFEPLMPGLSYSRFYISTWTCALLGLVLVSKRAAAMSMWTVLLPLSIALTHYAAVVLIFPHVYRDRLILPFYVLLVPYVAAALDVLLVSPFVRIAARSLPPPSAPVG